MALADGNALARVWKNVKEKLFNKSIVSASVKGKTVTFTRGDGTTFTIETKDTTYNDMTGATTTAAGTRGLVPAPDKGSDGRYLSSDGTWKVPPNQKYNVFRGATASAAGDNGLVPAPESGKQDSFLKGDGTWGTPTNTTYGVVSKSANGLAPKLPDETTTTKYLRQDGTWAVPPDNDTTYADMKGATTAVAGTHGLAPAPAAGAANRYLRSDGTWAVPPNDNTTYSDATQENHGLMPAADKKKLDGVEEGANKYVHPTSPGYKHIPSGGEETDMLIWSEDGTAAWATPSLTAASTQRGLLMQFKMGSDLVCAGLLKPATNAEFGVMHPDDKTKLDALPSNSTLESTYAKKTDISTVYRYCGSVENASKLPTTGQNVGDTYNIIAESKYGPKGENVTWNGTEWDPNGGMFEIVTLTDDEIDKICS